MYIILTLNGWSSSAGGNGFCCWGHGEGLLPGEDLAGLWGSARPGVAIVFQPLVILQPSIQLSIPVTRTGNFNLGHYCLSLRMELWSVSTLNPPQMWIPSFLSEGRGSLGKTNVDKCFPIWWKHISKCVSCSSIYCSGIYIHIQDYNY
jgi:hypothetical protein